AVRLLEDIRDCFGDRELFVGRELTKMHEENLWGTAAGLLDLYRRRESANPPRRIKGELVVVISAADRDAASPAAAEDGATGP
ncbi:MAG: hypothetical protein HY343_02635, partial [Lentisphaerae bacterium]|nr:hypothetical protein [Lentisphaerota bacterium]